MKVFLFLMIISLFYLVRIHEKSVADTRLKGCICHAFTTFVWMILLSQSEFLHEGLRLWIMTAEIAIDHGLILSTAH